MLALNKEKSAKKAKVGVFLTLKTVSSSNCPRWNPVLLMQLPFVGILWVHGFVTWRVREEVVLLLFTQRWGDFSPGVGLGLSPEFSARRSFVQGRSALDLFKAGQTRILRHFCILGGTGFGTGLCSKSVSSRKGPRTCLSCRWGWMWFKAPPRFPKGPRLGVCRGRAVG